MSIQETRDLLVIGVCTFILAAICLNGLVVWLKAGVYLWGLLPKSVKPWLFYGSAICTGILIAAYV